MAELRVKGVLGTAVVLVVLAWVAGPVAAQSKVKKRAPKAAKTKPVSVDAAGAALVGSDVPKAAAAATALGQTRAPAALEHLLDGLALGLDPKVAAAALESVAKHGSPKALEVARRYLHNRNRRVRAAAVTAVGSIDDSRAIELVLGALRDMQSDVRAAAVAVIQKRKLKRGIEPLIELLKKGDEAPAEALAAMADADLALALGELIGVAPDAVLARTLGLVLLRKDFDPEAARVQVVRTIGKIPGTESIEQLTTYMESIPEKPPRQSRREAETIIEQRLSGGN